MHYCWVFFGYCGPGGYQGPVPQGLLLGSAESQRSLSDDRSLCLPDDA